MHKYIVFLCLCGGNEAGLGNSVIKWEEKIKKLLAILGTFAMLCSVTVTALAADAKTDWPGSDKDFADIAMLMTASLQPVR